MPRKPKRKVDRRMHDSGEMDFEKDAIRVNPRKGDLINTIVHEELHRKYPDKSERWIKNRSKKDEAELTISKAIKLLQKYKRNNNGLQ